MVARLDGGISSAVESPIAPSSIAVAVSAFIASQFGGRRRALVVALDVGPHLLFADVRRDVGRDLLALEPAEVTAKRRPVHRHAVVARAVASGFTGPADRDSPSTIVVTPCLIMLSAFGSQQDRVVRVVVDVDEARRDGEAGGVDATTGLGRLQVANCDEAAVADADVGRHRWRAVAVDDGPAGDQQVVRRLRRRAGAPSEQ